MFAVVKTGGKQYCVKPGDVLKVEKIDAEPASVIKLNDVVLASSDKDEILPGATVSAEVLRHVRNRKVIIFKKIRRHNHRRKNGHRQMMTVLRITGISLEK